jgi:hypothetical protein
MKRTLQALMAFVLVSMILASTVSAATSQGLEWGIVIGDQYNFNITTTDNGVADMNEVIYMEVLTRPTIPNIVSNLTDIPTPSLNITWANGTSLGWSALIFIFLAAASPFFISPIGNFTLLGQLYVANSFYNGTIYDQSGYWGTNLNDFMLIPGNLTTDIHVDYLKQDGVLAHWTATTKNITSSSEIFKLSMVRQGLPTTSGTSFDIIGFVTDNALYIGIGVVIILLVVIIVKKH